MSTDQRAAQAAIAATEHAASISGRIAQAVWAVRARYLEPAWIILGQQEWYELRRLADPYIDWSLNPDAIPSYLGVNVATVPIGHYLEVVPRLPS